MGRSAAKRDLKRYQYKAPGHYEVRQCFIHYSHERLIKRGKSPIRAWIGFNNFMEIVNPWQAAAEIKTGQVEEYVDRRLEQGVTALTMRRELAFVKAALMHAHRRNRITILPPIELPEGQGKFRRPMDELDFRLVMAQTMSDRLRKFYWVAYYTGHRSAAIEELTWDRVLLDAEKPTIDFNVPGRLITNKRRAADFPIPEDFMPMLREWKASAKDEYVIGKGSTTYNEAAHAVRVLAKIEDPLLVPRHCMRKMFATECFERDASAEVVGRLLADDPNTLRKHYVQFKDSTLRDVANLRTKPKAA